MNDEIKVKCKKCGVDVSYSVAEYGGKIIDCPHCQQKMQLPSQLEIEFCSEFLKENSYFDKLPKNKSEIAAGKSHWPKQTASIFIGIICLGMVTAAFMVYLKATDEWGYFFHDLRDSLSSDTDTGSQNTTAPRPAQPAPQPAQQQDETITIKGFHLGMTRAEVLKTAQERLVDTGTFQRENTAYDNMLIYENSLFAASDNASGHPGESHSVDFWFEGDKLHAMMINSGASDSLFSSESLSADEFAQQFVNSYKGVGTLRQKLLPESDYISPFKNVWVWEYAAPDGCTLQISDKKEVLLFKADYTPSQIKNSFN